MKIRKTSSILLVLLILSPGLVYAQSKAKPPLPKVPVTYEGDTDETIARRAQWIERAKREGKLAWWSSARPEEISKIVAAFNKIYPFIKVDYWRGLDKERDARTEAEHAAGKISADIGTLGEDTSFPRWRKMGMIERFTDIVPGIKTMDKGMYSQHGDWIIPGNNAVTPQYNTRLIPPGEAPKKWDDLLDPRWKGQIGFTPDIKVWYILALAEGGWGIEKTEQFLKKVKEQNPIWTQGHSAGHSLLVAGEFKILAEGYHYHVMRSQARNAPVDWCRVEPVVITGSTISLFKQGPNPNAARLFLEWLFSPQGLVAYEAIVGKGAATPGSGTRLAKALTGLRRIYRTEELVLKVLDTELDKKFAKILGVTLSEGD